MKGKIILMKAISNNEKMHDHNIKILHNYKANNDKLRFSGRKDKIINHSFF